LHHKFLYWYAEAMANQKIIQKAFPPVSMTFNFIRIEKKSKVPNYFAPDD